MGGCLFFCGVRVKNRQAVAEGIGVNKWKNINKLDFLPLRLVYSKYFV